MRSMPRGQMAGDLRRFPILPEVGSGHRRRPKIVQCVMQCFRVSHGDGGYHDPALVARPSRNSASRVSDLPQALAQSRYRHFACAADARTRYSCRSVRLGKRVLSSSIPRGAALIDEQSSDAGLRNRGIVAASSGCVRRASRCRGRRHCRTMGERTDSPCRGAFRHNERRMTVHASTIFVRFFGRRPARTRHHRLRKAAVMIADVNSGFRLSTAARRLLPRCVWENTCRAAEDMLSRRSQQIGIPDFAFHLPESCANVVRAPMTTELFGARYSLPMGMAPTVSRQHDAPSLRRPHSPNRRSTMNALPYVISPSSVVPMEELVQTRPRRLGYQAIFPTTGSALIGICTRSRMRHLTNLS